ncbi:MAG: hypothetical protein MZV70_11690 [Desulfobacterales bacterium]|nr:hypothetical protein [Desulfobacterales bacterium]
MALIAIAHPKFRPWLDRGGAKGRTSSTPIRRSSPARKGRYPEELETYRKTKTGMDLFLRPIKMTRRA